MPRRICYSSLIVLLLTPIWGVSAESDDPCKVAGPSIMNVHPRAWTNDDGEPTTSVAEQDTFVLSPSCKLKSIRDGDFSFRVEGLADPVPARVLTGEEYLKALQKAGVSDPNSIALQPTLVLPNAQKITLQAPKVLTAETTGKQSFVQQDFKYKTRPAFSVSIRCDSQYADGSCDPLRPVYLLYSSSLDNRYAIDAGLTSADGDRKRGKFVESFYFENGTFTGFVFKGPFKPKTTWKLAANKSVLDSSQRALINEDSQPSEVRFGDVSPLAHFPKGFLVLETESANVPLTLRKLADGESKAETLPLVRKKRYANPHEMWNALVRENALERSGNSDTSILQGDTLAEAVSLTKSGDSDAFEQLGLAISEPGFYLLEVESNQYAKVYGDAKPKLDAVPVLVTNLAVHLKSAPSEVLIWVTALDSGKVVEGADVALHNCKGAQLWSGKTDSEGRATAQGFDFSLLQESCEWKGLPSSQYSNWQDGFLVSASLGSDQSFVLSSMDDGIENWRFYQPDEEIYQDSLVHTFLSQPIARRGDAMHFKHFFRKRSKGGFEFIDESEKPSSITLVHTGTEEEVVLPLTWSTAGEASSSWQVPVSAKLGNYAVSLKNAAQAYAMRGGEFDVLEYKPPLVRAELSIDEPKSTERSFTVPVGAKLDYLAGGGASLLPVKLTTQLEPAAPSFGDNYGKYIFGGDGQSLEFPSEYWSETPKGGYEKKRAPNAKRSAITKMTLDQNGAYQGAISLGAVPTDSSLLSLQAEYQDPNGQTRTAYQQRRYFPGGRVIGIKGDSWLHTRRKFAFELIVLDAEAKPVVGEELEVRVYERKAFSHRKKLLGKTYGYENEQVINEAGVICSGATSTEGKLNCDAELPFAGNVILEARSLKQPVVSTATAAWIAEGDEWWFAPQEHDRMDVLPERDHYEPGETAQLQVRMPFETSTALVTVEREGVVDSFVQEIHSGAPVIQLPIKQEYAPGVAVSVLAVRGRLTKARHDFLADFSKPTFKLGTAPITVGYKPYKIDLELKPSKALYKVREPVTIDIDVKGSDGRALANSEVAIAVVDEGILLLRQNDSLNLLESMMGSRGNAVKTATMMQMVFGKRHFGLKANPFGGGGGNVNTRELFDSLLYWNASVKTDENGKASVTFPANDSITGFIAQAVVASSTSNFGSAKTRFQVSKDVSIFSGAPRVIRNGDKAKLVSSVRNTTDKELAIELEAKATFGKTAAEPIPVARIPLPAKQTASATFELAVPDDAEVLRLETIARVAGETVDSMTVSIPVAAAVPVRTTEGNFFQLTVPQKLSYVASEGALQKKGSVSVTASAGFSSLLDGVVSYMKEYPYGCLEQRVSKALSTNDDALWAGIEADMGRYVSSSGLLSYFPSEPQGDVTLTAYVLSVAHAAGKELPAHSKQRAIEGLRNFARGSAHSSQLQFQSESQQRLLKLLALEALAKNGEQQIELLAGLVSDDKALDFPGALSAAVALRYYPKSPEVDALNAMVVSRLKAQIREFDTIVSLADENAPLDSYWWAMLSPDTEYARLLDYIVDHGEFASLTPKLLRAMAESQRAGHWDLTTANTWGAIALRKYVAKHEAEKAQGEVLLSYQRNLSSVGLDDGSESKPFPLHDKPIEIGYSFEGKGAPWVMARKLEAMPRLTPFSKGYSISKSITREGVGDGQWKVGDVLRVDLEVKADGARTWVVVDDPIPAGATILGSGLQGEGGTESAAVASGYEPNFIERGSDSYRAYFGYLPEGVHKVSYLVRLNLAGSFNLPATRTEAMYSPEMFGESPNAAMEIE
jgi:alpha-2-macroglobulin